MAKKSKGSGKPAFSCDEPPCLHVVYDDRRRIFAVFVEFDEENIFQLDADKLVKACEDLARVRELKFREANLQETDFLATRYLGARPVE